MLQPVPGPALVRAGQKPSRCRPRKHPCLLRGIRDQVAVPASRCRRELRPAVIQYGDHARVGQFEIPIVRVHRIEDGRERRRRRIIGCRLERAVGIHDRMHRRPREVLVDAGAGIRQRLADFRSDRDDRRRPLREQLLRRGDVALDRRVAGPAGKAPAATISDLHFNVTCGPERYKVSNRASPVAGPARTIAALPSCCASSRLRIKHGALRGADGAGDRALVGRCAVGCRLRQRRCEERLVVAGARPVRHADHAFGRSPRRRRRARQPAGLGRSRRRHRRAARMPGSAWRRSARSASLRSWRSCR